MGPCWSGLQATVHREFSSLPNREKRWSLIVFILRKNHPVSIVKLPLECNQQKQSQDKLLVRKLSSPLNGREVTTYQLWALTLLPSADSTNWGYIGDVCHAIAAKINHDFISFMRLLRWFHFYVIVPDAPEYENVAYRTETNSITLYGWWSVKMALFKSTG